MSSIVVTGATGYLGSALIPMLLEQRPGCQIRIQTRTRPVNAIVANNPAVRVFRGELTDPDFCRELCANADQVIHLAGFAHTTGTRRQQTSLNLGMTGCLAIAALASGVRAFIYISSIKANDPSQSAYAEVKLQQEQLLLGMHQQTFKVTCLRPALIYGPGMKGNLHSLLSILTRPWLPAFPRPVASIGLIGLQDCCRAIIASLDSGRLAGSSWQVAESRAYKLEELISRVRQVQGLALPVIAIPGWCVAMGIRLLQCLAPVTGKAVGMGSYHSLYSENFQPSSDFPEITGWSAYQNFYAELPHLIKSLQQ